MSLNTLPDSVRKFKHIFNYQHVLTICLQKSVTNASALHISVQQYKKHCAISNKIVKIKV